MPQGFASEPYLRILRRTVRILTFARVRTRTLSWSERYRIADPNRTAGGDGGEYADVGLMVLKGGAQNRGVVGQFALRMSRNGASDGRPNAGDADVTANRQRAIEPLIFKETGGGRAGIDEDVGAKAARIEIGGATLKIAQMGERAGRDDMDYVLIEEVAARRETVTPHDRLEFLRRRAARTDAFEADLSSQKLREHRRSFRVIRCQDTAIRQFD